MRCLWHLLFATALPLVVSSACATVPSPAAAPSAEGGSAPEAWYPVHTINDTVHSIDTLSLVKSGDNRFRVRYRGLLERPMTNPAGERFDRLQGIREYDCDRMRERSLSFEMLLGTHRIREERYTGEWEFARENPAGDMLRSACAYLTRRS